jgi:ribosomal protein S18 acetylase RimI-like enzyme
VDVRLLGPGDEAVAEEACRVFGDVGDFDATTFLRRPEAALLVAEDADGVVGWVYGHELVHPDGELTMLLYSLDVAERAQRQGHGRALANAFVEHARRRGCTEVWVLTDETNAAALATYRAAGAERDPGDQVMLSWRLVEGGSAP